MIDIHNHVLHGLDDGPRDFDMSISMVRAAIEAGITHLVCTPHANDRFQYTPAKIAEELQVLKKHFGDSITLGSGCDMHLNWDIIEDLLLRPYKYTINGMQYLLVELPDYFLPRQMSELLSLIRNKRLIPIVTHPERHPALVRDLGQIAYWIRDGSLVQITAASIIGDFGKTAATVSRTLLDRNWVHIVASDAHDLARRPFRLRQAHQAIGEKWGKDNADRLCIENPHAIFYGKELPAQPSPKFVPSRDSRTIFRRFLAHS
jgi:protein-tyrosine phosphatase